MAAATPAGHHSSGASSNSRCTVPLLLLRMLARAGQSKRESARAPTSEQMKQQVTWQIQLPAAAHQPVEARVGHGHTRVVGVDGAEGEAAAGWSGRQQARASRWAAAAAAVARPCPAACHTTAGCVGSQGPH